MYKYHYISNRKNMPYTYLIGWSKHNKWYYGARWSKQCHPSDLWKTYFTSSKHVKNFLKQHGNPDIVEIRKVFMDVESCKKHEERVLRKLNILKKDKWLNKNINGKFLPYGKQSPEHIFKRIQKAKQIKRMRGPYTLSEETKIKISKSIKGKQKLFTENHKNSIQKRLKKFNVEQIKCPHCDKFGQYTNMKRWHFDKCRSIPQ